MNNQVQRNENEKTHQMKKTELFSNVAHHCDISDIYILCVPSMRNAKMAKINLYLFETNY